MLNPDILHSEKKCITSRLFTRSTKVVPLTFIGAEQYIITDFGGIWDRNKIYPGKLRIVFRNMLPWVVRDHVYTYPWVLLYTVYGKVWFPINQLLGWAFRPSEDPTKKYFLHKQYRPQVLYPLDLDDFSWYENLPIESDGKYSTFMNEIYNVV